MGRHQDLFLPRTAVEGLPFCLMAISLKVYGSRRPVTMLTACLYVRFILRMSVAAAAYGVVSDPVFEAGGTIHAEV